MLALLRGIGVPPSLVGLARGVIEAGLIAGVEALITALPGLDLKAVAPFTPVLVLGLRFLEGVLDHLDESTQRAP